jgi:peroxiredoxin Q/BCP
MAVIEEGKSAPNFVLKGSDGKMHSLKEFYGKNLVLYFYPKDDTPGCTMEAKSFNEYLDRIKEHAAVVGVSKDNFDSHCKFSDKYGLRFLLLSDPESKTIKAYDSYGSRGIFGMGTLRRTFIIGKSGKVLKIFPKVSPIKHGKEVLDALTAFK